MKGGKDPRVPMSARKGEHRALELHYQKKKRADWEQQLEIQLKEIYEQQCTETQWGASWTVDLCEEKLIPSLFSSMGTLGRC